MPRPYEAIVAKLLAKDPTVRYPTAGRAARRPAPLPQRRARWRWRRRGRRAHRPGDTAGPRHSSAPRCSAGRWRTRSADGTGRTAPGSRWPPRGRRAARYYEPPPSRTGWYTLAAFFALVALGIGGVLLFNALSGDDDPGNARALDDYVGQELSVVTDSLNRLQRPYSLQEEDQANDFGPNIVTRTDPAAG